MIVIGLTGEKLGGKGTFTELLRAAAPDKRIIRMGFGNIIGEILDILGKPRTREHMQILPLVLMQGFHEPGIITNAVRKRIEAAELQHYDFIILDGIRRWEDLALLRSFPNSRLVYVTANRNIRYERARKRLEKIGESELTLAKFVEQDVAEIERLIPEIGKKANFPIVNERSLDHYRMEVEIFMNIYLYE